MPVKTRVTLKDIAVRAEVTPMTVSLALRNHPRIPAETRLRIASIADDLGYSRDPKLCELMSYLRKDAPSQATIAFLSFHERGEFRGGASLSKRFCQGLEGRAAELGYKLERFYPVAQGLRGRRLTQILETRGIRGLIIPHLGDTSIRYELDWSRFATVVFGYSMKNPEHHRVSHHHAHGIRRALKELREREYRRIGLYLHRDIDYRVDHQWVANYLQDQVQDQVQEEGGVRIAPLLVENWEQLDFQAWVEREGIDAVLTVHAPAYQWLLAMGKDVPEECGFVHLDWSEELAPISGINQKPELIGATAVDLLNNQLMVHRFGVPENAQSILLEGSWVEQSTVRSI